MREYSAAVKHFTGVSGRFRIATFPAALVFGLPSAIFSHALVFGRDHVLGGETHELLIQVTVALVVGALGAVVAFTLATARGIPSGTLVAARLRRFLPHPATLAIAAGAWFALVEAHENAHHSPLIAEIAALTIVAFMMARGLRRGIESLARAVVLIVVACILPTPRAHAYVLAGRGTARLPRCDAGLRRPIVRPPPRR